METGIDPTVIATGDATDEDFFDKNFGPGKLYPGGPTCTFKGKDIPCMVRWSPKGSITSPILADALAYIDSYDVFKRSNDLSPFLLLDGHNSRFEIPFLEYITDERHPWQVCIGVPYGTSLWQVADSKEQNGSYKIALTRAKKDIFEAKLNMFIQNPTLCSTDIVPLINEAWSKSFTRVNNNKKAISECGWGPLNRNLLLHKELHYTMTQSDREALNLPLNRPPPSQLTIEDLNKSKDSLTDVLQKSSSGEVSLTSDIMCNSDMFQKRSDHTILSLNYTSGQSSMVLDTLVVSYDLQEARMRNKRNKEKGIETSKNLDQAKALTAMYHFTKFGCKIGKSACQKKKELFEIQQKKVLEARKNEEAQYMDKKRNYDAIMVLYINDEKLSRDQLKSLLNFKKWKADKGFSSTKKKELLQLWKEWKVRLDTQPEYDNNIIESVAEVSHDATLIDNSTLKLSSTGNYEGTMV